MDAKICDLQRKEIVNVTDGTKLGFVDDVTIDTENARVKSLVVFRDLRTAAGSDGAVGEH